VEARKTGRAPIHEGAPYHQDTKARRRHHGPNTDHQALPALTTYHLPRTTATLWPWRPRHLLPYHIPRYHVPLAAQRPCHGSHGSHGSEQETARAEADRPKVELRVQNGAAVWTESQIANRNSQICWRIRRPPPFTFTFTFTREA
jgi:hypothetical protein